MSKHKTINVVIGVAILAAAALSGQAQAQSNFPSKTISLIVPWSPGGGSDRSMRLVAATASKYLGQSVIVVNKPGAGGANGTRAIASAKADGYTIGMVGAGVVARQYNNPNANPLSDLVPIVFFGTLSSAVRRLPSVGNRAARLDTYTIGSSPSRTPVSSTRREPSTLVRCISASRARSKLSSAAA